MSKEVSIPFMSGQVFKYRINAKLGVEALKMSQSPLYRVRCLNARLGVEALVLEEIRLNPLYVGSGV